MKIVNQFIELCCYVCALYFLSGIKLAKDIWKYGVCFFAILMIGIFFEKSGSKNVAPIWLLVQTICLYSLIMESRKKKFLFSIGAVAIIGFFNMLVATGLSMLNISIVDLVGLDYSLCICLVILLITSIWMKLSRKNVVYPKISNLNYVLGILMTILMTGLLMCEVTYLQNIEKRGAAVTTVIVISTVVIT